MTASLSHSLADQGIVTDATIYANFPSEALTERALARGEGRRAKDGPLVVETGKHTGRSAKDKFIVRDAETEGTVWWDNNAAIAPEHFAALKAIQPLFQNSSPLPNLSNVHIIVDAENDSTIIWAMVPANS